MDAKPKAYESATSRMQQLLAAIEAAKQTAPVQDLPRTLAPLRLELEQVRSELAAHACASVVRACGETGGQALQLSGYSLTAVPPGLAALRELRELNLSVNALGDIATGVLGSLPRLTSLNLAQNRLVSLPADLALCSALQSLDVRWNALVELPADLCTALTALTTLRLAGNALAALPAAITSLTLLQELNVETNPLAELPPLTGMVLLRSLNITSLAAARKGARTPRALRALPVGLESCTGLEEIFACYNAIRALPAGLGKLIRLRRLHLGHNAIAGDIPADLTQLQSLYELDLSHNRLSREACLALRHAREAIPALASDAPPAAPGLTPFFAIEHNNGDDNDGSNSADN